MASFDKQKLALVGAALNEEEKKMVSGIKTPTVSSQNND